MFLLAANRMSRGYARLRQWLIMAMRMAAIAGLIFAVSRPLAGRLAGADGRRPGRHDDHRCSTARPACSRSGAGARGSKLETGVRQLVADARDAGLGSLGLDRQHDQQAARARDDRRPA